MCGITGKINLNKDHYINSSELKLMSDALYHRGPDDEGFYIHKNVGLGFRRLSIIDLNSGHQPLSNEDQTIWIVFNGEIYNYKELKERLIKQGHHFRTQSDTEIIIHLYEQYGTGCLKYLRGMFAFCIWDDHKKQLFCARDHFGIKPLYYYSDKEKFVFGSEIKAILKAEEINKTMSYEALDSYFTFGYITSDLSIYKNIKKLQPGHYLLLTFKDIPVIEIKKYWEIYFEPDYTKTEKQWLDEIEACFSETVRLHMVSDVPLGAFLSGGIDSGSVVSMMANNSNLPIKTFAIGFNEAEYCELKYAREIAKKYGCEHYEQIIEPESINLLPTLVRAYDEPFADSSAIPTYYASRLAGRFVKVALSGDGGDELFAGYPDYAKLKRLHALPFNFKSPYMNKMVWGNIHKLIPQSFKGKGISHLLSQNKEYAGAHLSIWTKNERQQLLNKDLTTINYEKASELYKEDILKKRYRDDFISRLQYLDMKTYMVDNILTKVDRASMINSLEIRTPFLDHKFAELSFKIPWNLKLKGDTQKYILKKSMNSYLTEDVLKLPKKGFGVPLAKWFKEDLRGYVNDTLLSPNSFSSKYLDGNCVKKTVNDSHNGMRDFSSRIWSLLFFEEWLKQNQ